MKKIYILFLTVLITSFVAQPCGGQFPSGLYHNNSFVTSTGDTLNKLNSNELYEGLHLYTNDKNNFFNDTIAYTLGRYINGLPVGEWTVHCSDGYFSTGQFEPGAAQITSDDKGGWIEKKQGIYAKIGVWKYFNKDRSFQKTLKYERDFNKKGWTDKTSILDKNGNFVLIEYKFIDKHVTDSPFKKQITRSYNIEGKIISRSHQNFWKDISVEYYSSGKIEQKLKCKKIIGFKTNTEVLKKFSESGRLIEKNKGKCWTTDV